MRIGILGGTFDPIHIGHLLMAEQGLQWRNLDQVWFIPAPTPPHKQGQKISSIEHRLEMVKKAVETREYFYVHDIEMHRQGPSYTIDTIMELYSMHPSYNFFLILGADMVKDLPNWYKIEKILQLAQVIGIHRPGIDLSHVPHEIYQRVDWVHDGIEINVSSSFIRQHIQDERILHYIVPARVYQYIKEYSLYEC